MSEDHKTKIQHNDDNAWIIFFLAILSLEGLAMIVLLNRFYEFWDTVVRSVLAGLGGRV